MALAVGVKAHIESLVGVATVTTESIAAATTGPLHTTTTDNATAPAATVLAMATNPAHMRVRPRLRRSLLRVPVMLLLLLIATSAMGAMTPRILVALPVV